MAYQRDDCACSQETIVGLEEGANPCKGEEAAAIDVEKLGRQRPEVFASTWREVAFVVSSLGSLAMVDFLIGGFQVLLPALVKPLDIPAASQTWPSSVLTLVAGAFLFPLGRLSDIYGGYLVFNGGMIWFTVWTVITGFSNDFMVLTFCRGMEGLGAAAILPAGISLLGKIYRPGPRKNLVFSLYGALAPMGFFGGLLVGGVTQDLLTWRWYFWIAGMISGLFAIGSLLTSPQDYAETRKMNVKMDWLGTCTIVPGLMFMIYAITDSTHAPHQWASPRIIVTFILGILFLSAAVYVEGWVASAPLLPPDIFRVKNMKRTLLCLLLTWGAFSIFLFYSNFYIEQIIGMSPLLTGTWFAPWIAGGIFFATTSGLILHMLPGRVLLVFSGVCKVIALLLFALMPAHPNYWAWVFPAMLAEAACVDILWTVSNVYLTTSLPKNRQGLAGALISVTLFLGSAFFLGLGEMAISRFKDMGLTLQVQYRYMFWLGVGIASLALVLCCFIRLGKAGCALTVDEKMDETGVDPKTGMLSLKAHADTWGVETPTETGSVDEEFKKEGE